MVRVRWSCEIIVWGPLIVIVIVANFVEVNNAIDSVSLCKLVILHYFIFKLYMQLVSSLNCKFFINKTSWSLIIKHFDHSAIITFVFNIAFFCVVGLVMVNFEVCNMSEVSCLPVVEWTLYCTVVHIGFTAVYCPSVELHAWMRILYDILSFSSYCETLYAIV